MNARAIQFASATWWGPPLLNLQGTAFDQACAALLRVVQEDYPPSMIVGIRTGGLVVAEAMARSADPGLEVLPITCRRDSTDAKARVPMLRTVLGALPRPIVDLLRRAEHQFMHAGAARPQQRRVLDPAEAAMIAASIGARPLPARLLVVDDACDSGTTLAAVIGQLRTACPPGCEIRSAVITQTLEHPVITPDYTLHRGTLCRFPWSFDAG